jgi:hypothetical protein
MLDLVNPLGSNHLLPFWPGHHLPYIIFHDGCILLHHGLLPHSMVCSLLISGRLCINKFCHQGNVPKSLWWFTSSEVSLWKPCQSRIIDYGRMPLRSWSSILLLWNCIILLLLIIIPLLMILSNSLSLSTYT